MVFRIGADDLPRVLVFNKCDQLPPGAEDALRAERPDAWYTSAHVPARVADLHDRIAARFRADDEEFELFVPWDRSGLIGQVRAEAHVVSEDYEDDGVRYRLRAPAKAAAKLQAACGGPLS